MRVDLADSEGKGKLKAKALEGRKGVFFNPNFSTTDFMLIHCMESLLEVIGFTQIHRMMSGISPFHDTS
jgi:hypothetical protein